MKILPEVRGVAYRASALQYFGVAFNAAGSRSGHGRFDRSGVTALYLSMEMQTAYAEFQGGRPIPRPCALMSGDLLARNLLDLSGDLSKFSADMQGWNCDWEAAKTRWVLDPNSPASDCQSWRCGDLVLAEKLSGIYFPSTKRAGGFNVAIFIDNVTVGDFQFSPHDPMGEIRAARLAPS